MTRRDALALLGKLREVVEHPNTEAQERDAALVRIRQLRKKHKIGHIETSPPRSRGRPKKDPLQLRDKILRFLVNADEYTRIVDKAKRRRMSVSAYLRLCALEGKPKGLTKKDN